VEPDVETPPAPPSRSCFEQELEDPRLLTSRRDETAAGWEKVEVPAHHPWRQLLRARIDPRWDHFEWLTVRALFESVNDKIARLASDIVWKRRAPWGAAHPAARGGG
jgi:hypothetical protein